MKEQFTQKYCLVQLMTPLLAGHEFVMTEWPLHVTLADVFKITGEPDAVLASLAAAVAGIAPFSVEVVGEDWFGPERTVQVRLLEVSPAVRNLHETCVAALERFDVVFNSPQFMRDGFRPHSTVHRDHAVLIGDKVQFDALTLIDMFPAGDAAKRCVVGTVPLGSGTLNA